MDNLFELTDNVQSRWASPENPHGRPGRGGRTAYGRKGMPYFFIRPGKPVTLAHVEGQSGVVRRIWMTLHDLSPLMLRQMRIQFFWDEAEQPAVNVPLGDFFGMGLGRMAAFNGSLFASPEGRSFICQVPMPFRQAMRIVLHNDGLTTAGMVFYEIDYTVNDKIPDSAGYFHAWYNQENPTLLCRDYTILDRIEGRGRFLGASFGVAMNKQAYSFSWGGEGEVKIYLDDDDEYPTLCGTGTEDYIGTGWCQGEFSQLYGGCTIADEEKMHLCFYRYHVPDPVWFQKAIRVTIQQIGSWNPDLMRFFRENGSSIFRAGLQAEHPPEEVDFTDARLPEFDLFERSDNWSSCCYFYLDKPMNNLPPLPEFRERVAALPDFRMEELENMKEDFAVIDTVKKYVPDLDNLDLEQLQELNMALNMVIGFMNMQNQALQSDEE